MKDKVYKPHFITPEHFDTIKKKISGKTLSTREIQDLINDCTTGHLLPIELAAFITGLEVRGAEDDEVVDLCLAMANSGDILNFGEEVYDKHSTGGVPGNKVTFSPRTVPFEHKHPQPI